MSSATILPFPFDATAVSPARVYGITLGRHRSETRWTDRKSLDFDELCDMLSRDMVGPKDGPC
jgi:hypothetical protein